MTDLPVPPVPADCDLTGFPFMPLDCARLLDSDLFALATGEEFKAAVALWCKSWAQVPAGSLSDDPRVLAHLASVPLARWKKIADMALRGWFKASDGRLYHPVVSAKAAEAWSHRERQRERARKGNAVRWGSPGDRQGIAEGSLNDRTGQGQGQGQENPAPSPSPDSAPGRDESQKTPAATATAQLSVRIKSGNIGKIRCAVQSGNLMGLVEAFGGNTDRGEEWARDAGDLQFGTILAVFDWRAKNRQPIREPSGLRVGLAAWHEQPQEVRRKWIAELLADLGLAGQDGQA
jgi:hypothetical protein